MVSPLDLEQDVVALTEQLINVPSVSGDELALADAVEAALGEFSHLALTRVGNTIVARTDLGHAERVVIAGHLDTVPENQNLPASYRGEDLYGLGSCDMKGGVAVALRLARLAEPTRDVTYVFYDCEEVEASRNGLGHLARQRPDLLTADFAILMEPSNGVVEAGCQGTLRVDVRTQGERAHSARSWMGRNAIHAAAPILASLAEYRPRRPMIDGLEYHEGLNAVFVRGGVAGNVVPDECVISVNYRFAPDRSLAEAEAFVREFFSGYDVTVTDAAPGALPGLQRPAAAAFVAAMGGEPTPKFGWTDVARFTELAIPAVNFGPGNPIFAHKQDEHVPIAHLRGCEERLMGWLS